MVCKNPHQSASTSNTFVHQQTQSNQIIQSYKNKSDDNLKTSALAKYLIIPIWSPGKEKKRSTFNIRFSIFICYLLCIGLIWFQIHIYHLSKVVLIHLIMTKMVLTNSNSNPIFIFIFSYIFNFHQTKLVLGTSLSNFKE